MKKVSKILLILVSPFVLSCDDADLRAFPEIFYKTQIVHLGNFRVFDPYGEVNNTSKINAYMFEDTAYFNSLVKHFIKSVNIDTIRFTAPETAIVSSNYITRKCHVQADSSRYVLTRTDTTSGFSYGNEFSHHITYHLVQVKPDVFSEYLHSSTRGLYSFGYRAREKFILEGLGSVYVVPYIVYAWRTKSIDYPVYGYINNLINPEFYNELDPTLDETLTLMEFWVLFEKKK